MLAAHLDGVWPGAASAGSLRHPLPQVGVRLHREAEVGLLDVHAEQLVSQSEISIVSTDQSETSIVRLQYYLCMPARARGQGAVSSMETRVRVTVFTGEKWSSSHAYSCV